MYMPSLYNIKGVKIAGYLLIILVSSIAGGCQSDIHGIEASGEVMFSGKVSDMASVKTRLDTFYITSLYDTNFYIQQNVTEDNGAETTQYGVYHVPSGYQGRLNSVEGNEPLMWQDLTSEHTFYAWTIPWDDEFEPNDENTESIGVKFYDSTDESGYNEYKNNKILEQFIGAKSGPYSYSNHGKYVDFTFNHLISKIKIGTFQLIESSGAIQKNLKADITFIGMPDTATFYPHPAGGGAPYVKKGPYLENEGVSYYIFNDNKDDYFYICPEIDFTKINFQVKLRNEEYVNNSIDIYYGTFENVKFERVYGNNYDKGDGSDDTVLHAGEVMTLNISLIPGIGPGLAVTVDKWSTEDFDKDDETLFHSYPGMYSDSEVNGIVNLFSGMNEENFCDRLAEMRRLFELYGKDVEEGDVILKVLYLYENVTVNSNIFPLYREYILNGLGHVITMNTNYGNPGNAFGSSSNYFNIGPARDVYLSNPNGTIRLYIDPDGYVWTYDANTGQYNLTTNQLTPLEGSQKSYDIDAATGTVRKSNYFNNPLGEKDQDFPSCD